MIFGGQERRTSGQMNNIKYLQAVYFKASGVYVNNIIYLRTLSARADTGQMKDYNDLRSTVS